jgi:L-lactate dehydrogenase complex protein LldG
VEQAAVSAARDEILGRVRAALAGAAPAEPVVRAYRRGGDRGGRIVELLCERLVDYKAEVRRVEESGLPEAIAETCAARSVSRLGVPPGLPTAWRPAGIDVVDDHGL